MLRDLTPLLGSTGRVLWALPTLFGKGICLGAIWASRKLFILIALLGWLVAWPGGWFLRQGSSALFSALIGGVGGSVVTIAYEQWPKPLSFTVGEHVGFGYPRVLFDH